MTADGDRSPIHAGNTNKRSLRKEAAHTHPLPTPLGAAYARVYDVYLGLYGCARGIAVVAVIQGPHVTGKGKRERGRGRRETGGHQQRKRNAKEEGGGFAVRFALGPVSSPTGPLTEGGRGGETVKSNTVEKRSRESSETPNNTSDHTEREREVR